MEEHVFPIIGNERHLPVYLVSVGQLPAQDHITRPAGFPVYQVILCMRGAGTLHVGGKEMRIAAGQGFLLFPQDAHEYYPTAEPWETHWVTFDGGSLLSLLPALGFSGSKAFAVRNPAGLEELYRGMMREAKNSLPNRGINCSALLYQFLLLLSGAPANEPPHETDGGYARFEPVVQYIDEHYSEPLGLEELAQLIGVSRQYLCRLFRRFLHMRPFEYVVKRRMQEAKRLLLESDMPVAIVAEKCGCGDPSYFCSVFRQNENMSPQSFRSLHRSRPGTEKRK